MTAGISATIGDQIRDLRKREGLTRDELAATTREAGAPDNFTAAVVGFLETHRRPVRVDEVLQLAAALEVSPLELLGDHAGAFVGAGTPVACPRCGGTPGEVERTVRADIAGLADPQDLEPTLAQTAYVLARAIDGAAESGATLSPLTRELRACVEQIRASRRGREEPDAGDGDDLDDLNDPDGGGPDLDDLPD